MSLSDHFDRDPETHRAILPPAECEQPDDAPSGALLWIAASIALFVIAAIGAGVWLAVQPV